MRHRNPLQMERNALAAIPSVDAPAASMNQIFNRQDIPRLPRGELRGLLDSLVGQGVVQEVLAGCMVYYRRARRSRKLASDVSLGYNGPQRNQFSLNAHPDRFLQAMYPLRLGKSVALWMDDAKATLRKQYRGPTRRLVIVSPGQLVKLPRHAVLVSIIGTGSCIVPVNKPTPANLVLAGMPVKLANQLVGNIQRVFKE